MAACLETNRVPDEEFTACIGSSTPHIGVVVLQVRQRAVTDKLVQDMAYIDISNMNNDALRYETNIPLKSKLPSVSRASLISSGLFPLPKVWNKHKITKYENIL